MKHLITWCEATQLELLTYFARVTVARNCEKELTREKWVDDLILVTGGWYNVLTPKLFCSDKFEAEYETTPIDLCMGRERHANNQVAWNVQQYKTAGV